MMSTTPSFARLATNGANHPAPIQIANIAWPGPIDLLSVNKHLYSRFLKYGSCKPGYNDMNYTISREYGVLIEEGGNALHALFDINLEGELRYQSVSPNN